MQELIEAGFTLIPLQGKSKLPFPGFPNTPYETELDRSKFPANYGVLLSDDILVIDIDPRNFEEGDVPHVRLFDQIGIDFKQPMTPVVRTGSGGYHVYLRKPQNTPTREKIKGFRGVDFKSTKGRFMVGPESVHPDTGKPYTKIRGDFRDIRQAPAALLDLLRSSVERKAHKKDEDRIKDTAENRAQFTEFCRAAVPAIEGESGDQTTYSVACKGYAYGLSDESTFAIMLKEYNPRCEPPWKEQDLWKKVQHAYKYAQGKPGDANPENEVAFTQIPVDTLNNGHVVRWDVTDTGKAKITMQNCVNHFIIKTSPLLGCLAYDEFQGEVMIIKPLPWHKVRDKLPDGRMWSDDDTVQCRFFLNHTKGFDAPTALINEAVLVAAHFNKVHPVREYLSSLKWDGKPRLNTWLTWYAGVEDDIYVREVSKKVLVHAVARIFQPGCKVDTVVVLEGAQGIGKSSLVRILGGKWYADVVIDPHSRDTVDAMRGKWFIEFSEMEVTRREVQALKAFITRQTDRARLAYGRRSFDYPRQCLFMGTINPDSTSEWMTDETGNRRWWPIRCGHVRFFELERDRDQLFAEAVDAYYKGEVLYVEDKHVLQHMEHEQNSRMVTDPWMDSIQQFLRENEFVRDWNYTTTQEIWEIALRGTPSNFTRHNANRICNIMRRLGWSYNNYAHPIHKSQRTKAFRKQFKDEHGRKDGIEMSRMEELLS